MQSQIFVYSAKKKLNRGPRLAWYKLSMLCTLMDVVAAEHGGLVPIQGALSRVVLSTT
jgi:hypothetical protein